MVSLSDAASLVKATYILAVYIRDTEKRNDELKRMATSMAQDLTIIGGVLDQVRNIVHQVVVTDENILNNHISSLQAMLIEADKVLRDVKRNRNFFQRLFLRKEAYQQQLRELKEHLHRICMTIQGAVQITRKVEIPIREFADFRKLFQHLPEKTLLVFDFSIIRDKPNSITTINMDEFDKQVSCHMKLDQELVIFSNQIRTWISPIPKAIILGQRRAKFQLKYLPRTPENISGSSTSLNSLSPTLSDKNERLDFTEYFMSNDDVCGMALTKTMIYIATKYEITIVSLTDQKIIAQYGFEGEGDKSFKHISSLYIPFDDENNLYIVDDGQSAIHHYKIDSEGDRFEFIRRYIVIANVIEQPKLVSCVIYTKKLFVSDDSNNCLHVFALQGDRQTLVLRDNSMTPFSPGALCVHDKYLYVANCSSECPSIVVFDAECNPVDWFRNKLFEQILAIDICPNLRELFILTTTNHPNDTQKKRPMIVTTDLCIRAK